MNFQITCHCGHQDTMENLIHVTENRKVEKIINGEKITNIIYDRIFHCPNCGFTEKKTCSLGAGGSVCNEDYKEEE